MPDPDLIEYRVTFGSAYAHQPHPVWNDAHPDGWLTVLAPDELTARRGVIAAITNAWSSIYGPADRDYPRAMSSYFRLGEIGRMQVLDEHTWQWLRCTETGEWVPKPVVWAFCNGTIGLGDQQWVAIADDGRIITTHVSGSRSWGRWDVSPQRNSNAYSYVLGTADVDYRVLPDGQGPPPGVRERYDALVAAQARTDGIDGER